MERHYNLWHFYFIETQKKKHILYVQEVVTRPKILNRSILSNWIIWTKIILLCKRIITWTDQCCVICKNSCVCFDVIWKIINIDYEKERN